MVQFSNVLIGVIVVALVASGAMLFFADGSNKYSTTDYNSSSLQALQNSYYEINKSASQAKDSMIRITQEDTSSIDKVGYFFTGAYQGAKLLLKSFTSIFTIGDAAIGDGGYLLGDYSAILKMMIPTIIIIIIVVAIVMHIITKSDRL